MRVDDIQCLAANRTRRAKYGDSDTAIVSAVDITRRRIARVQ